MVTVLLTGAVNAQDESGKNADRGNDAKTNPKITYDDHVKDIFRQRCLSCHAGDNINGDLDVSNFTNLMNGGSSGSVIEPGDPSSSYLFSLVTHDDEPVMPPGARIPDKEIETIRAWIQGGALQNRNSKVSVNKGSLLLTADFNPLKRPDKVATFPRMSLEPVLHTRHPPVVVAMAACPWSSVVAVAGKKQIVLFDSHSTRMIGVLPFPEGTINVLRFSQTGGVLLAAGGRPGHSGVAVIWDVNSGQRIARVGDEIDAVLAADITPNHAFVALAGRDRIVRIYSVQTGKRLRSIKKHTDWVTSLAFSTDGKLLATADRNGGLHVWDTNTGSNHLTLKGHPQRISSVAWRGDNKILASGGLDGSIKLWSMKDGRQIKTWMAHQAGVNDIQFAGQGQILSAGNDQTARLFAQNGKLQRAFPKLQDIVTSVVYCKESGSVFAAEYQGRIPGWNADDGKALGTVSANPPTIEQRIRAAQSNVKALESAVDAAKKTTAADGESGKKSNAKVDAAQNQLERARLELQRWLAEANFHSEISTLFERLEQAERAEASKQIEKIRDEIRQLNRPELSN